MPKIGSLLSSRTNKQDQTTNLLSPFTCLRLKRRLQKEKTNQRHSPISCAALHQSATERGIALDFCCQSEKQKTDVAKLRKNSVNSAVVRKLCEVIGREPLILDHVRKNLRKTIYQRRKIKRSAPSTSKLSSIDKASYNGQFLLLDIAKTKAPAYTYILKRMI